MRQFLWILLCALGLVAGCNDNGSSIFTIDLERAEDIALVCFDREDLQFVEQDRCDFVTDENLEDRYSLIALVTQTSRGEIAAIELTEQKILDIDRRIPGSTFVAVGDSPSAIAVQDDDPRWTYVTSFGSRTLEAIPTNLFHPDAEPSGLSKQVIQLEDRPNDLVISPDGKFVYVVLSVSGQLLEFPILSELAGFEEQVAQQGPLGEPRVIELSSEMTELVMLEEGGFDEPYEKVCSVQMQAATQTALRRLKGEVQELSPLPLRAVFDAQNSRLLVSDGNLHKVHILDRQESGQYEPTDALNFGVPVDSIVISPEVPRTLTGELEDDAARYLYGVDKRSGDVLVMDYHPSSPFYGAVLPVSADREDPYRIDFGTRVNSLSMVVTGENEELCEDDDEAASVTGPSRLRGVFLFAGLIDGTIRVVDIYDLDANCRGGIDCSASGGDGLEEIYLRRNRFRVGELVFSIPKVNGTPSFQDQGVSGSIDDLGNVSDVSDFGLTPIERGCPTRFTKGFPILDETTPLICIHADPWRVSSESWTVEWEGIIDGTEGESGHFSTSPIEEEAGDWWHASDIDFCHQGVLGDLNVSNIPPELFAIESAYRGDVLVITEEPDLKDENCSPFINRSSEENNFQSSIKLIGVEVAASYEHYLRLGEPVGPYSIEDIRACFQGAVSFQIQVANAYSVSGTQSGFEHRVISGDQGICEIDPSPTKTEKHGRAFSNRLFTNSQISFQVKSSSLVGSFGGLETRKMNWSVHNAPLPLFLDTASVAESILFSPLDQRLYVVNSTNQIGFSNSRGPLIVFELNPLRTVRSYQ